MKAHRTIPTTAIVALTALSANALVTIAFGQEIRFVPIRSAPLGSPVGTIGSKLDDDCSDGFCNVDFNAVLGCWEVLTAVGVEIRHRRAGFRLG